MTKARKLEMRAVVVLIAGLLALATVWAGSALGGGSGGSDPAQSGKNAPAQKSDPGFVQEKGDRGDGRDCPNKDRDGAGDVSARSKRLRPAVEGRPASACLLTPRAYFLPAVWRRARPALASPCWISTVLSAVSRETPAATSSATINAGPSALAFVPPTMLPSAAPGLTSSSNGFVSSLPVR